MAQAAEDPRATVVEGNVVFEPGGRDDCPTLWPGSHGVVLTDVTVDKTYVDITAEPAGVDVVGVIVKGGPRYNKYDAGNLGELPWLDLRSPLNNGGNIADISHWFACGVDVDVTTTPTTATTTTSPGTTTTPGTTSPGTTTSVGGTTAPDVTPTSGGTGPGDPGNPGNPGDPGGDDLADTGANPGWLLITGLLLLIAGALALVSPRVRGALGRR
ncbi:hypothetical protein ACTG9Q_09925 [Actinokineospora sp. 24-640]